MKKLLQQEFDHGEEHNVKKSQQLYRVMEHTELSLAPTTHYDHDHKRSYMASTSPEETGSNMCRKRKSQFSSDDQYQYFMCEPMSTQSSSVDLQVKGHPLPLDWEQCLDLQSGRMYYLNRKTLRKSWEWPKQQKVDLDLNISSCSQKWSGSETHQGSKKQQSSFSTSSSSNMVALPCLNCHLLVILSKSSPSCPNCKYIHSLPTQRNPPPPPPTVKSLDTLSLLN